MNVRRLLTLAVAAAALWLPSCGSSATRDLPSKTEQLDGFDVALDVRRCAYQNGQITFEALAKNGEPRSLIGLSVELSLRGQGGRDEKTILLEPIGMRAPLSVLEPGYGVPIVVHEKVASAPASVVAKITKAERFAEEPDVPQALAVRSATGADTAGLEVVTFGHFRVDSVGDPGAVPFHAMLGIRNTGASALKRLDYGVAFTDEKSRDVDRIPVVHVFEPPLKPGDAILEPVSGMARPYARIGIDVRSVTKSE